MKNGSLKGIVGLFIFYVKWLIEAYEIGISMVIVLAAGKVLFFATMDKTADVQCFQLTLETMVSWR